jgi:hypothetical protein
MAGNDDDAGRAKLTDRSSVRFVSCYPCRLISLSKGRVPPRGAAQREPVSRSGSASRASNFIRRRERNVSHPQFCGTCAPQHGSTQ